MRRANYSILAVLTAAAFLAASPASSAGSSTLSFAPCPEAHGFECATLTVPLDRGGRLAPGRTIALSVERKLAGATPSKTAVVALAGGPGQAAIPLAPFIAEAILPALQSRDLIVFDQRGTGASAPLSCPALAAHAPAGEAIAQCAAELGPARGAYTTGESVQDIEAIRQAGGYEQLALYGTSYGTKVALEYAQSHPAQVQSLVLDSTETPEGPEPFHVGTYQRIGPMFEELCADGACAGIAPRPLHELAALVAKLEARPLRTAVYDGRGRRVSGTVSAADLFELLLAGDLNPVLRAELPADVHAALRGDPNPLARLLVLALSGPKAGESGIDEALFVATSCEETPFPWSRQAPQATRAVEAEAALDALPASDFYPFSAESALLDSTIPTCVAWPDASPAPGASGPLPAVPTLILSGGQDLRTPRANALAVARMIPGAQVLDVPYTGHSVVGADLSGCVRTALVAFFSGTSVPACPANANRLRPTPAIPASLARVAAVHGVGGLAGRTASAVLETVGDVRATIVSLVFNYGAVPIGVRLGGLRGGYLQITSAGVQLHRLTFVPGVAVSGLVPSSLVLEHRHATAALLTVGGSTAAAGRLRVPLSGTLTGRLGGHGVHAHIPSRAAAARSTGAATGWGWPGTTNLPAQRSALARVP